MTQIDHRRRRQRVVIVALIILVAFLAAVLWGAIHSSIRAASVEFAVEVIRPHADAYCPGDVMTYDVDVTAVHYPVVLELTETWCEKGLAGRCSAALSRTWHQAVLEPRKIQAVAQRRIPADPFFRPGGTYQLYHAVINGREEWYIVDDIKIKDSCP